jgi:hypothetical protein
MLINNKIKLNDKIFLVIKNLIIILIKPNFINKMISKKKTLNKK